MSTALQVDTNLTYCPISLTVNQPLIITNVSEDELVFKIKTNKKNLLSMNPCNGFLKPFTKLQIPVKIVQHVPQNVSVKLQVDWCKVTQQMKQKNDIKMATALQKDIFKKVFPIIRKQSQNGNTHNAVITSESKPSIITSALSDSQRIQKDENKITPFQIERKQIEQKQKQSPQKNSSFSEQVHKEQEQYLNDKSQSFNWANRMLDSLSSPSKNLQIVSEEDEEDHQKQLEQIRSEQVNQRRLIDEVESKIRKINQQVKSTQIIDARQLFLGLIVSFLIGSLVQYLIF